MNQSYISLRRMNVLKPETSRCLFATEEPHLGFCLIFRTRNSFHHGWKLVYSKNKMRHNRCSLPGINGPATQWWSCSDSQHRLWRTPLPSHNCFVSPSRPGRTRRGPFCLSSFIVFWALRFKQLYLFYMSLVVIEWVLSAKVPPSVQPSISRVADRTVNRQPIGALLREPKDPRFEPTTSLHWSDSAVTVPETKMTQNIELMAESCFKCCSSTGSTPLRQLGSRSLGNGKCDQFNFGF